MTCTIPCDVHHNLWCTKLRGALQPKIEVARMRGAQIEKHEIALEP